MSSRGRDSICWHRSKWRSDRTTNRCGRTFKANGYLRVRVDGETHSVDEAPQIDRRRKHRVEIVVDRVVVKKRTRSRIAESVENAPGTGQRRAAGRSRSARVRRSTVGNGAAQPAPGLRSMRSQLRAADAAQLFVQQPLGWCPACEGLGTQTGANPAALLSDPKRTLAEGAVALWPDRAVTRCRSGCSPRCPARTGIPLDVPSIN